MFVFNVIDVIGCFLNKIDILKLLLIIITYKIQINSIYWSQHIQASNLGLYNRTLIQLLIYANLVNRLCSYEEIWRNSNKIIKRDKNPQFQLINLQIK